MLAFPTGALIEGQPVDVHAVASFGDLGRAVERVAVQAAEHGVDAVCQSGGAPATDLRLDDREALPRVRVEATDERATHRREVPGRQAVAASGRGPPLPASGGTYRTSKSGSRSTGRRAIGAAWQLGSAGIRRRRPVCPRPQGGRVS